MKIKLHEYYVYIVTNYSNNVLYTGMTNDLKSGFSNIRKKLIQGSQPNINVTSLFTLKNFSGLMMLLPEKNN